MIDFLFCVFGILAVLLEIYALSVFGKIIKLEKVKANGKSLDHEETMMMASYEVSTVVFFIFVCLGMTSSQWFPCLTIVFLWFLEIITIIKTRNKFWYKFLKHFIGLVLAALLVMNVILFKVDVAKVLQEFLLNK